MHLKQGRTKCIIDILKKKKRRDNGLLFFIFMLEDILHIQFSLFSFEINKLGMKKIGEP